MKFKEYELFKSYSCKFIYLVRSIICFYDIYLFYIYLNIFVDY